MGHKIGGRIADMLLRARLFNDVLCRVLSDRSCLVSLLKHAIGLAPRHRVDSDSRVPRFLQERALVQRPPGHMNDLKFPHSLWHRIRDSLVPDMEASKSNADRSWYPP